MSCNFYVAIDKIMKICDYFSFHINNLQLEVSRKQTLNLSTHLAVFELLAYWLQVGDKYHTAKLR